MSSRTVSVVLTAQVQNYLSNMRAAEERTRDVERAARTATQQFAAHNEALGKVGATAAVAGGAVLAGLGLAIKASPSTGRSSRSCSPSVTRPPVTWRGSPTPR
jgi:hypothetical protein